MALALYRRYRPDTFEGVIGQDQVTVPLMRALDQNKLTHAYLFSGPRGCGKTSSARILARCVNCAKGPTSHPCGECESCKDLATGGPGSIDVVEIDAASHNGVDDARELRERAGFAPARDRYKIFILDEAHMVTQQGFNALLKIVEEPPEHVMFIFATTEPEKVIGTIRSRTHHYPFRLVPQEVMGPYLEHICEQEHIRPEAGVLKLAMRAGGGSMRDTLSVLDQLMVGSVDDVIPYDAAVALLGFTPEALIGEAIDAVIDKNGEALYAVVQKVVVGGFDPRRFVEDLLSRVRDLLVLTLGGERAERVLSDAAAEDMEGLHRQAAALSLQELTAMAEIINTALGMMSGTTSPRMRLELLAAKLLAGREQGFAVAAVPQSLSQQPSTVNGQRQAASDGVTSQRIGFAGAARNQRAASGFVGSSSAQSSSPASVRSAEPRQSETSRSAVQTNDSSAVDQRTPEQKWDAVLAALPSEIREYVNHDKVTAVSFTADGSGKGRLSMTFDSALSQHAFSLAVATDAEHSGKKASIVVLDEVRRTFGARTMIAPTGVAANGEHVVPIKRLSAEQLAQVKTQIAMAKAGVAASNLSAMTAGRVPDEPKSHAASNGADSSDAGEAAHQDVPRLNSPVAVQDVPVDDDPWAHPLPASSSSQTSTSETQQATSYGWSASSAGTVGGKAFADFGGDADDDPWMTPVTPAPHARKHVDVPDPNDNDDPWAHSVPQHQPQSNQSSAQTQQTNTSGNCEPQAEHHRHFLGNDALEAAPDDPWGAMSSNTGSGFGGSAQTEPSLSSTPGDMTPGTSASLDGHQPAPEPQVAPEDDEYSLNDESLGEATALSIDELSKMFDVKKVEDFAADDPKNPKNIQPAKHTMN